MSWRTVLITKKVKLEFRQNFLVCRGEVEFLIHISEIGTLIIENTAIALTATLINELVKQKVKIIFCDEKRNPMCEICPYYDNYISSKNIRLQIAWHERSKQFVWTNIVHNKIYHQFTHLSDLGFEPEKEKLLKYMSELEHFDVTNREGHAAKVYFNALFGKGFARSNSDNVNSALNYGYSIILSAFNREIVSSGYLTQLGIFHNNEFNNFNLSSDLMEPFRILIDRVVYEYHHDTFDAKFKHRLIEVLDHQVIIDNKKQHVSNAIKIYVRSVFNAIEENNSDLIKFYEL